MDITTNVLFTQVLSIEIDFGRYSELLGNSSNSGLILASATSVEASAEMLRNDIAETVECEFGVVPTLKISLPSEKDPLRYGYISELSRDVVEITTKRQDVEAVFVKLSQDGDRILSYLREKFPKVSMQIGNLANPLINKQDVTQMVKDDARIIHFVEFMTMLGNKTALKQAIPMLETAIDSVEPISLEDFCKKERFSSNRGRDF